MTKIYTKNEWTDELLAGEERYDILADDDSPIEEDVQIKLTTAVAVAGTSMTAELMNNIEDGVDALDTAIAEMDDGKTFEEVDSGDVDTPAEGYARIGVDETTKKVFSIDDEGLITHYGLGESVAFSEAVKYTSSGTWTKADYSGLYGVIVELWGGGGSGGGVTGASGQAAAAGGATGGGYSCKLILADDLGTTETVTIGAGGAAPSAGNNNGNAGGTTSFGSHCSATGGSPSNGQGSNATVPRLGSMGGNTGGVGSGGDINLRGEAGDYGLILATTIAVSGKGGSAPRGGTGGAARNTDANGNAGNIPGGGGSGAASSSNANNRAGGAGARGECVVWILKSI
jgi:hypothetical protein